jgi:hypothetical protein
MTDAIYDNIEITTTVHVEWKETGGRAISWES